MSEANRILGFSDLLELIPFSRAHIDRLEKKNQFPRRLKLGLRRVGWRQSEVLRWIDERAKRSVE